MTIIIKNKGSLIFKDLTFNVFLGKIVITIKKMEVVKKTPRGYFTWEI